MTGLSGSAARVERSVQAQSTPPTNPATPRQGCPFPGLPRPSAARPVSGPASFGLTRAGHPRDGAPRSVPVRSALAGTDVAGRLARRLHPARGAGRTPLEFRRPRRRTRFRGCPRRRPAAAEKPGSPKKRDFPGPGRHFLPQGPKPNPHPVRPTWPKRPKRNPNGLPSGAPRNVQPVRPPRGRRSKFPKALLSPSPVSCETTPARRTPSGF